jgi:type I restriction enzyme S subunit
MSRLNFDFVPLTFINDQDEIKKQIKNTLILIYLFEKYNNPVRLEKLIEGTQYGYNASALQTGRNKFLRISDIHESKVNWETVPFCNCADEKTYLLKDEDILIARTGGTTGKSFKIKNPPKQSIYAGYLIRIRAKAGVNADYIYLFLHSFAYWSQIVNLNERNFRPKANAENLKALMLPNCLKEIQDEAVRISRGEDIKGYENLFAKIEKILLDYDKTQDIQAILADQLKQIENFNRAILQEAVQGKLVNQDTEDESTSELLKRVKAEKLKLGVKEKSLSSIKSEDIPFVIPSSWQWCRMGDAVSLKRGKSKFRPRNDSRLFTDGKIPFIQTGDVAKAKNNNDLVTTINGYYNDFGLSQSEIQTKGTLCITIAANIAECGFLDFDACVPDSIVCLQAIDKSTETYIYHYLKLAKADLERFAPATAQKNINLGILNELLIPLPPLPEQKRIIAEIEKQFAKTKLLKEYVIANQFATEQLLATLLRQAFEVKVEAEKASTAPKVTILDTKTTDFCREDILAAEIVWQLHKQATFGHLKLQKLIYLCQKTTKMDLSTNFLQQAMGPYDPKLMRSLDSTLMKNGWFHYEQTELLKYKPLGNAGKHRVYFNKYFESEKDQIQVLINNFRSLKSEVIEIVATLYSCLDTILNEKVIFSEALLVKRFFDWSEEKEKFSEKQVSRVFKRMIETGIVPAKFTELTSHVK